VKYISRRRAIGALDTGHGRKLRFSDLTQSRQEAKEKVALHPCRLALKNETSPRAGFALDGAGVLRSFRDLLIITRNHDRLKNK